MKKILIIDDSIEFVELLELSLSRKYQTQTCKSIEDINLLKSTDLFDVVLSDYNLGLHQGQEIMDSLKKQINIDKSKLILVSGSEHIKDNCKTLGMHGFLEKPFKIRDLKAAIEN